MRKVNNDQQTLMKQKQIHLLVAAYKIQKTKVFDSAKAKQNVDL